MPNDRCRCLCCVMYINDHDQTLKCDLCQKLIHKKCLNLFDNEQFLHARDPKNNWSCEPCNTSLLPFNSAEDNTDFIQILNSNDVAINNIEDLTQKLFDTHELEEVCLDQLEQIDPDQNFYHDKLNGLLQESHYINTTQFNKLDLNSFNEEANSFFHLNIRSIPKKISSLETHLKLFDYEFSCIALTETWLKPHNADTYGLDGYTHKFLTRTNKVGGGVSLFIKNNLTVKTRDDFTAITNEYEALWCEIENTGHQHPNTIVGVIYRAPGSNPDTFLQYINDIQNCIQRENKQLIYMGDFNLDLLNLSSHPPTEEFLEINLSHSVIPMITKPTRITSSSATLIDNIFTNSVNASKCLKCIVPLDISDHYPIVYIQQHDHINPINEKSIRYTRIYNDRNYISFTNKLIELNLNEQISKHTDTQAAYTTLNKNLLSAFNQSFPKVATKSNYKSRQNWLTPGIKRSIMRKNYLYRAYIRNPSEVNKEKYKKFRNILTSILRKKERDYYNDRIDAYKANLKKTWDLLKRIINKKRKQSNTITSITLNGNKITDPSDICNKFNNFFVNIGHELDKKIPISTKDPISFMKGNYTDCLYLRPCNSEEIAQIINNLKNCATGHDEFPSVLLKRNLTLVKEPIMHILNLSLASGVFPKELKRANVVPIFKSGDFDILTYFRPISLLTTISKIFEKAFYTRLSNFLIEKKILLETQFGFRPDHSTYMALLTLMDAVIGALERGDYTIGVFLDFSKAFDTVNHQILLRKLDFYGIHGIANSWIKDYLSNRTQTTTVNGHSSEIKYINCGVPQGSILGPLLFLVYINDLGNISKLSDMILFADDSNLFMHGPDLVTLADSINKELETLSTWLIANRLSLNVNKTNYIVFNPKPKTVAPTIKLAINRQEITKVEETKFLGVIIDSKLSWKPHIHYISKKVAKSVGIISKARKLLDHKSLKTLYYSFVHPYLIYCNIAWGNAPNTTLLPLLRLQKIAIRLITNTRKRDRITPKYVEMNILKLQDIYYLSVAIFMQKYVSKSLPQIFEKYFISTETIHPYGTRNASQFRPPIFKTQVGSKFVKKTGIPIWSDLSKEFGDSIPGIRTIKTMVLKKCMDQYKEQ